MLVDVWCAEDHEKWVDNKVAIVSFVENLDTSGRNLFHLSSRDTIYIHRRYIVNITTLALLYHRRLVTLPTYIIALANTHWFQV